MMLDWSDGGGISTLAARLDELAQSSAQKQAIRTETQVLTYGELQRQVRSAALWLAHQGVGRGDRVIISVTSGTEVVVTVLACALIGAIYVPVSPLYSAEDFRGIARSCGARVVIGAAGPVAALLGATTPTDYQAPTPVLVSVDTDAKPETVGTVWRFGDLLASDEARANEQTSEFERPQLLDNFALVYTSGTSGNAKAVVVNQFSGLATGFGIARRLELSSNDVVMSLIPMISYINLCCIVPAWLSAGCSLVIPPLPSDYSEWMNIIDRFDVTFIHGVPTHYVRMLACCVGAMPLGREIKGIVSGAECAPHIVEAARSRLGIRLCNHYGLAEFGGVSVVAIGERDPEVIEMSVGEPFEWVEVRICNKDGMTVAYGDVGEIRVRGPGAMRGYYGDGALLRKEVSQDGWISTGDLGRLVDHGNLQLVGRATDMMIRGGNNVHPSEVESALLQIAGIHDAVVFGIPDAEMGEAICACIVVPEAGRAEIMGLLAQALRGELIRYKWPDFLLIVDEIPTNLAGKALRRMLRDQALERNVPLVRTAEIMR